MPELKDCPYCHKNKLKIHKTSKFQTYSGFSGRLDYVTASVRCNLCHARGPTIGGRVLTLMPEPANKPNWATTEADLEAKAIAAWNQTGDPTELDVKLPCAVGATAYVKNGDKIAKVMVSQFYCLSNATNMFIQFSDGTASYVRNLGKNWWLNQKEARQAIRK